MRINEEMLIAYADGELAGSDRVKVEQALAGDPALRARLDRHRRLGTMLSQHYAPVAEQPLPDRLTALLRKEEASENVIDLAAARAQRETRAPAKLNWSQFSAIAATLIVGLFAGHMLMPSGGDALIRSDKGALIAQGLLAHSLETQLASAQTGDAAIRIGLSFRDGEGHFCRSFDAETLSGIACKAGDGWRVPITAANTEADPATAYRQAGSGNPLVLQAAGTMMLGDALDAKAERAARDKGWR